MCQAEQRRVDDDLSRVGKLSQSDWKYFHDAAGEHHVYVNRLLKGAGMGEMRMERKAE